MAQLGSGALIIALALAIYGIIAGVIGARRNVPELVDSAVRAVWGVTALILVAVGSLITAFATHNFQLVYVAGRSSLDMPLHYVLAAFYGGQEGSLLYWSMIAGLLSSLALILHRHRDRALVPYLAATVLSVETFLLLILTIVASPFTLYPAAMTPANGVGLNPLLRDPGMMIHPPFLLAGFASFTVPFGFAMAALITGRLGSDWIRAIRRWALVSWGILGIGLLLGAWWAYHVLGWGGYWGWDPVENVALLPWLTSTAFIHSVIVQERRGMLKVWNMSLVVASFILSVFGTFTVRSGLISSVHSFAVSPLGPWFLGYLSLVIIVSVAFIIYRIPGLQSDRAIESVVSRESGFLVNNLLFTALAFATFWGTVFPLVGELFDKKLMVGPPFYDQVNGPILLALLLLMGIGPLLAWRQSSPRLLLKNLFWPVMAGLIVIPPLLFFLRAPIPVIALAVTVFGLGTVVLEYVRGARVRHQNTGEGYPRAVAMLVRKNGRRYGGYIVHIAVALLAFGIIGSHFFQVERQFTLNPNEKATVGAYTLTYQGLDNRMTVEGQIIGAKLEVAKNGESRGSLESYRFFYRNYENQPTARMGIKSIGLDDVYVVLDDWDTKTNVVSLRIFINPLVNWIWLGGLVYVFGMFTLIWPAPSAARQRETSPVREAVLREA